MIFKQTCHCEPRSSLSVERFIGVKQSLASGEIASHEDSLAMTEKENYYE